MVKGPTDGCVSFLRGSIGVASGRDAKALLQQRASDSEAAAATRRMGLPYRVGCQPDWTGQDASGGPSLLSPTQPGL